MPFSEPCDIFIASFLSDSGKTPKKKKKKKKITGLFFKVSIQRGM